MQILKKFGEKPAGVFDLCGNCHTLLYIEISDLKMVSDPDSRHLHAVPIRHNFHYKCYACKTLVDLGSTKTDSIPYQIHERKLEKAREKYVKLSPKKREVRHIF